MQDGSTGKGTSCWVRWRLFSPQISQGGRKEPAPSSHLQTSIHVFCHACAHTSTNICKYKKTIHSTFLIVCFWLCYAFCFLELVLFFPPPSSLLHVKRIPSKNHPKYHIMERAWNDSWVRHLDYQSQCMKVNLVMLWDVSVGNFFMLFKNFY